MRVRPIIFREACAFVAKLHRHNEPPRGHKFSIGVEKDGVLVGVAMVGRPIARAFDDDFTAEINRTCTDGTRNANSMLYGAAVRACKAMGYRRIVTYTQKDESGSSLRAAGFVRVKQLAARGSWLEGSKKYAYVRERAASLDLFEVKETGGVERILWEVVFGSHTGG